LVSHGWQVPLSSTARGLCTSPIPAGSEILEIEFDFISRRLVARTSRSEMSELPLEPQTVGEFCRRVIDLLNGIEVGVAIHEMPNEVPNPIPFSQDRTTPRTTPPPPIAFGARFFQVDRVFKLFRTGFLGKGRPVHFFWGSFDLAVTRFSGRPAPRHPGGVPGLPRRDARSLFTRGQQRLVLDLRRRSGDWQVGPHGARMSLRCSRAGL
jgi:hypothetical protein